MRVLNLTLKSSFWCFVPYCCSSLVVGAFHRTVELSKDLQCRHFHVSGQLNRTLMLIPTIPSCHQIKLSTVSLTGNFAIKLLKPRSNRSRQNQNSDGTSGRSKVWNIRTQTISALFEMLILATSSPYRHWLPLTSQQFSRIFTLLLT